MVKQITPNFEEHWEGANVILRTENSNGKELHANKEILGKNSSYFKAIFFSGFKEAYDHSVEVDCDYKCMLEILRLIHSGEDVLADSSKTQLLKVCFFANKLGFDHVKSLYSDRLSTMGIRHEVQAKLLMTMNQKGFVEDEPDTLQFNKRDVGLEEFDKMILLEQKDLKPTGLEEMSKIFVDGKKQHATVNAKSSISLQTPVEGPLLRTRTVANEVVVDLAPKEDASKKRKSAPKKKQNGDIIFATKLDYKLLFDTLEELSLDELSLLASAQNAYGSQVNLKSKYLDNHKKNGTRDLRGDAAISNWIFSELDRRFRIGSKKCSRIIKYEKELEERYISLVHKFIAIQQKVNGQTHEHSVQKLDHNIPTGQPETSPDTESSTKHTLPLERFLMGGSSSPSPKNHHEKTSREIHTKSEPASCASTCRPEALYPPHLPADVSINRYDLKDEGDENHDEELGDDEREGAAHGPETPQLTLIPDSDGAAITQEGNRHDPAPDPEENVKGGHQLLLPTNMLPWPQTTDDTASSLFSSFSKELRSHDSAMKRPTAVTPSAPVKRDVNIDHALVAILNGQNVQTNECAKEQSLSQLQSERDLATAVLMSMAVPGDLQTHPSAAMIFNSPFEWTPTIPLKLTNVSLYPVTWMIKAGTLKIVVTPDRGVLHPKEECRVEVTITSFNPRPSERDAFLQLDWRVADQKEEKGMEELFDDGILRRKHIKIAFND